MLNLKAEYTRWDDKLTVVTIVAITLIRDNTGFVTVDEEGNFIVDVVARFKHIGQGWLKREDY